MTAVTHDIVAKLWNRCNVLKDDGVTYHQYVTELTYLLFLKMAQETGTEDQLPAGYRWGDLEAQAAPGRLEFYKILLIHLGTHGSRLVQEIFASVMWSFTDRPVERYVLEERRGLPHSPHRPPVRGRLRVCHHGRRGAAARQGAPGRRHYRALRLHRGLALAGRRGERAGVPGHVALTLETSSRTAVGA